MTIISGDSLHAICERNGQNASVSMLLVGAQDRGTRVLVHLGAAVRVLEMEEAKAIDDALDGLAAALSGESFEHYFADLIDRSPELPAFLRDEK